MQLGAKQTYYALIEQKKAGYPKQKLVGHDFNDKTGRQHKG